MSESPILGPEIRSAHYILYCHGGPNPTGATFELPKDLGGKSVSYSFVVEDERILRGYGANMKIICDNDDVIAEKKSSGELTDNLILAGGAPIDGFALGIYLCTPVGPTLVEELKTQTQTNLEFIINYIIRQTPISVEEVYKRIKITLHVCRGGYTRSPRELQKFTVDDLTSGFEKVGLSGGKRKTKRRKKLFKKNKKKTKRHKYFLQKHKYI